VNITKWVILGGGLILLGLFTKEAATRGLTSTLQRTGIAGQSIGTGLSGIGSGIGDAFRGLLTPLWEVGNFAKSFGFGGDNISGQGYSTNDPQAIGERIGLTGQGGGFIDAEQQGGGDTGVNTDPIGSTPNWFNFDPFPQAEAVCWDHKCQQKVVLYGQPSGLGTKSPASGIFNVGGSNIQMSQVFGQSLPLSQEARDWYSALSGGESGGGSNTSTGGGGGINSLSAVQSGSGGQFGATTGGASWGL
jgi:hypothetical protein